ncbi:MAG: hypothetical protein ABSH22_17910 [Tepidisphaeraceae bacterium]|jgi:hypothetical protein
MSVFTTIGIIISAWAMLSLLGSERQRETIIWRRREKAQKAAAEHPPAPAPQKAAPAPVPPLPQTKAAAPAKPAAAAKPPAKPEPAKPAAGAKKK